MTRPAIKKATPPAFKVADYNHVIDTTRLVGITMVLCDFHVRPQFYDKRIKRKLSSNRHVISATLYEEPKSLNGLFRFEVFAKADQKLLLKLRAEYIVTYEADTEVNMAAAEEFCRRVGMLAAYPYFRSLVAQMGWGANIQLPPLPTISSTRRITSKQSPSIGADKPKEK